MRFDPLGDGGGIGLNQLGCLEVSESVGNIPGGTVIAVKVSFYIHF